MTARLGDHFPPEVREDFFKRNLVKGAVLRAQTELTVPPKIKLFVVWGLAESLNQIGISFINREISFVKNPKLQTLQYPLFSINNPFLTYDSYLDCSKIYEKNLKKVRDLLMANNKVFLGNISSNDLLAAEKIIQNAPTIEHKLKRKYGFI